MENRLRNGQYPTLGIKPTGRESSATRRFSLSGWQQLPVLPSVLQDIGLSPHRGRRPSGSKSTKIAMRSCDFWVRHYLSRCGADLRRGSTSKKGSDTLARTLSHPTCSHKHHTCIEICSGHTGRPRRDTRPGRFEQQVSVSKPIQKRNACLTKQALPHSRLMPGSAVDGLFSEVLCQHVVDDGAILVSL